jgi:hypothetical protein
MVRRIVATGACCVGEVYFYITITILDIVHRLVSYLKLNISETGICLRLQVEPTQLGQTDRERD